jgi:Spy/CpxP family protein refolding chaperone
MMNADPYLKLQIMKGERIMKRRIFTAILLTATLVSGVGPVLAAPPADPMEMIVREAMREEYETDAMMLSEYPCDPDDCGPPRMLRQEGRHHGGEGPAPGMGPREFPPMILLRLLDLTDAQKKQIAAVVRGKREQTSSLLEKRAELGRQLRQAEGTESLDEKKVRNLTANLAQLKADLIVSRAKARGQVRAVLTPAQRELVKKLDTPMEKRPGSGRNPGHERR